MSSGKDQISRKIYVHEVVNPPVTGLSIDVTINIINSKYLVIADWQNETGQQSFNLKIIDPLSLGLQDFQDNNVEKFIDKLLLVCNLVLKSAAFSRHQSDSSRTKVERETPQASGSQVTETPNGIKIEIHETVRITDSVHISIGFQDELDEAKVVQIMKKLDQLENLKSNLQVGDLKKSLNEYSAAMSSFDRLGIFKHLYSSMELATNCDGYDRSGIELDAEVNRISGIPTTDVEEWRRFNGRAKHIDKTPLEEKLYQETLQKLGEKISPLRETCQKIILSRLPNI